MDHFLKINNLVKAYHGAGFLNRKRKSVLAVDRVSFDIERNSVFGLVGESGCGKTSLVRALLYIDPPTSGDIWFDGTRLGDLSSSGLRSFRKRMQIVFQDPNSALNPKMRIADSLEEGLINRGLAATDRTKYINKLLDMVGIPFAHRTRYPHEFSGGQKQRIVIARALSMEPELLILDEPVSNLDVSIQAQIINLLLDLKTELALTYLFISHDLNLVAYLSDRIGVMYQGRLVELASTEAIMTSPCHPYTIKLFSSVPGNQSIKDNPRDSVAETTRGNRVRGTGGGCPYADECRLSDQNCRRALPELTEIHPGHQVACSKSPEESTGL